ncbi:MAG: hypothetical protein ACEPOW_10065 [Bacteroidales bacterium]
MTIYQKGPLLVDFLFHDTSDALLENYFCEFFKINNGNQVSYEIFLSFWKKHIKASIIKDLEYQLCNPDGI